MNAISMGFPENISRFAVECYCGDEIKVMDCITKYQQLFELFPDDQGVKEALLLTDRDMDQAIDYLSRKKIDS